MKTKTAEFVISNSDYNLCPTPNMPEYAFIGRSNVGKSSLVNALTDIKNLAKISSKPGKTQLINHFLIDRSWYLVDLPGYGYAKISKTKRAEFDYMINNYLLNRNNLICLFVLIDSRHSAQKIDQNFMKWLSENKIPFAMIFTKGDKLGKNGLASNIEKYKMEMLQQWEALPNIFITSALKKKGLTEILKYIKDLNPQFEKKL
mgnify:FL=1|tara:strand:- start:823 stop:1431 length:609 start_codon:yes stop_codon:yes gene_type:complete